VKSETAEFIMKTKEGWRRHLSDLVNASLDPVVYAVQWANDPRCMQRGVGHRRVGAFTRHSICPLWNTTPIRKWD
jgi:hypothetical protein